LDDLFKDRGQIIVHIFETLFVVFPLLCGRFESSPQQLRNLIGLLFVFIIMLMFFAMRFQQATQTQTEETKKQSEVTETLNEVTKKQNELIDDLTDAETARREILERLGGALQREGINVIVVKDEGILRLPEDILFERSSWEIKLSRALDQVLPCYTVGARSRQSDCPKTKAKIEAIFVEGHADSDPFRSPTAAPPAGRSPPPINPPSQNEKRQSFPFNILPGPAPSAAPAQSEQQRSPSTAAPRGNFPPKDNLDLSTLRATSTCASSL
jgi:hypothetical protein